MRSPARCATPSPHAAGSAIDEIVRKTVDVSWRTLKSCTWETYMDCPYYEQLQYLGDTRLQCLITYMTTGDTTVSTPGQASAAMSHSPHQSAESPK